HRPITHLSGGQQQRAHIARALVASPDLVVMDEPMAGIDAHSADVLGLLTGVAPVTTAVIVAIAGAVLIEVLRAVGRTSGDLALAMLFYGGIAGGVLLTNLADESAATLN